MIPLRDWNSYLKSIYEFPNAMDTIPIVPTEDEVFSLDAIEFVVKRISNGKAKDIEGYQEEIFKIEGLSSSLTYTRSSIYQSSKASLNPGHISSLYLFLKMGHLFTLRYDFNVA
jgi:hypothetical protein